MPETDAVKPPCHVLLVDDNANARQALARLLQSRGLVVCQAGTVAEAMGKLDGQSCLILDLDLPDGDGTRVLERVRAEHRPIKVAVYSGSDNSAVWGALANHSPDALFTKASELRELLEWAENTARERGEVLRDRVTHLQRGERTRLCGAGFVSLPGCEPAARRSWRTLGDHGGRE